MMVYFKSYSCVKLTLVFSIKGYYQPFNTNMELTPGKKLTRDLMSVRLLVLKKVIN